MRWSYAELLSTPAPVVEELIQWMTDMHEEQEREQRKRRR